MNKPTIGRIVHVPAVAHGDYNNGGDIAAAVITRVWSDTLLNVRVITDGTTMPWKTSITLHESNEAYEASGQAYGCYWPPRA